jgi:N-acetylmuramoyl-L-alanine amidase
MMIGIHARSYLLLLALGAAACASAPTTRPAPRDSTNAPPAPAGAPRASTHSLPPIPAADGALRLDIGYPPEGGTIAVRDSNFIFGATGSGRAQLTINSQSITVSPNGAFLAFIPVPPDGVYRLSATKDGQTVTAERRVRIPAAAGAMPTRTLIAPGSAYPSGAYTLPEGELLEVGFRGTAGGRATLVLPNGDRIPLVEQGATEEFVEGDQFRTTARAARPNALSRYSGILPAVPITAYDTAVARPRIGSLVPMMSRQPDDQSARPSRISPDSAAALAARVIRQGARFELVVGSDTVHTTLPLNLGVLDHGIPRVAVVTAPANPPSDWRIRGRADVAGPFHYFWPAGTRLLLTGERNGMARVRLSRELSAWVPLSDVRLLPANAPAPAAAVASARFYPQADYVDLRIPMGDRLPFRVEQEERVLHIDVFGATSRANFFQYGQLDDLIEHAEWSQPSDSVFRVTVRMPTRVWGYDTFYDDGGSLVLRIRRPPVIDVSNPLRGLLIAVDAGHGGEDRATRGPTGLTEADANLYVALKLRDLLTAAGARVLMIRSTDTTVALNDRPRIAAEANAHILVSVHNNAFPDGVNPFTNSGTSAYYYQPHSSDLARLLQRELLAELGTRDIGHGRADLALVRPTWMPSVLSETMFMMVPEQEAALRDPATQERIARAHVRALEEFLRQRARN